jgi:hypothetical protein
MVDERTGTQFSNFYETKGEMIKPTYAQLNQWKASGHGIEYIRLDNAGKNIALQE